MQWVADNAEYPAVVSASIAGDYSAALNQAAQSLVRDFGIPVVAAAGGPPKKTSYLFCQLSRCCLGH